MNIFQPMVAEGYEWINAVNDRDYETFLELDGSPRAKTWVPVPVRRVAADDRSQSIRSDFPWLGGHVLILGRRATDALDDILQANGELLPLAADDGNELFAHNTRVIDAFDEANSVFTKIPGTGRIMRIAKVAFHPACVEHVDMFRLPHRSTPTYVSERFVQRTNESGLQGLRFKQVWPA